MEYFQYTVALLAHKCLSPCLRGTRYVLRACARALCMWLMNIFMRDRHNNIHTYIHTYIYTEISIDQTNTRSAQAPLELEDYKIVMGRNACDVNGHIADLQQQKM